MRELAWRFAPCFLTSFGGMIPREIVLKYSNWVHFKVYFAKILTKDCKINHVLYKSNRYFITAHCI